MAPEGYYPDPSIPGYVRYWNGLSWVPGTSRPAAAVPAAAVPAARSEETGPVFLDEPAVWQADPLHQAGFGGPRDRRVSWGSQEPRPGVSLARPPVAEPLREDPELPPHRAGEGAALDVGGRADTEPAPRRGGPEPQGSGFDFGGPAGAEAPLRRGREDTGAALRGAEHDHALPSDPWNRSAAEEASRRPPGPGGTPPAAPAPIHAWPEAAGASMSGMTSSWPEAEPRREPGPPRPDDPWPSRQAGTRPLLPQPTEDSPPRPAEDFPSRENTRRPAASAPSGPPRAEEAWPPRAAGTRPVLPQPADDFAPPRGATAPPREDTRRAAQPAPSGPPRAEEAWPPRPAGTRPVLPQPADAAPSREGTRRPADDSAPPRVAEAAPRVAEAPPRVADAPRADTPRDVFERMAEHAVRPAGLGRRFTARVLDSLVYAAVAYAAAQPLLPGATAHVQAKVDTARASGRATTVWLLDATITGQLALVLGAVLLFGILYEVLPTARWGRTPGKGLLGVRVLATATLRPPRFGAALRRWLVYAFLGLPGSLACLANRPRRQAWHDKAAKTYVSR
ncbi:RDD family protein [Streptomyces sp. NPDC059656]|uniref:RDD family protein n=1 Tax=Streptomyces sp. NPDC059656 TaxID=3346898 RepID=UPI00369C6F4F